MIAMAHLGQAPSELEVYQIVVAIVLEAVASTSRTSNRE